MSGGDDVRDTLIDCIGSFVRDGAKSAEIADYVLGNASGLRVTIAEEGGVWSEVAAERARAHAKHGDTSMESQPVDDLLRLAILVEEVGEVAKEFNEARHNGTLDLAALRKELIQTAAMAGGWADAIGDANRTTR